MSDGLKQTTPDDPVANLMAAGGSVFRLVALACAVAALFLPGLSKTADGSVTELATLNLSLLSLLLPVLIAVAAVVSAMPAARRSTRLIDLVAAVVGVLVSGQLILAFMAATREAAGFTNMPNSTITATAQLGLGTYAAIAATVLIALAVLRPGR